MTKKKELERIDQENMKLMNRIVNQNARLNTRKFEEEYRQRKRLQKSLQRNKLRPIQNMLKKKMKNQRSLGKLPTIAAAGDTPQRRTQQEGASFAGNETKKRERTTDFIKRNRQEVQKKTPIQEKRTPVGSKKGVRATPGKNSKYRPVLKDREQKTKASKEVRASQTKKKSEDPYKNISMEKDKKKTNSSKSNRSKVSSSKESSNKINIETASQQQQPSVEPQEQKSQEKPQEQHKEQFAFGDDDSVHEDQPQKSIKADSSKQVIEEKQPGPASKKSSSHSSSKAMKIVEEPPQAPITDK